MKNLSAKLLGIHFDVNVEEEGYEDDSIPWEERLPEVVSWDCIFEPDEMVSPKPEETVEQYILRQGCKNRIPANPPKGVVYDPKATGTLITELVPSVENLWFVYEVTNGENNPEVVYAAYMFYDEYPFTQEENAYIVLDDYWELCRVYKEGDDGDGNILVAFDIPDKELLLKTKLRDIEALHASIISNNAEKILAALSNK